MSSDSCAFVMVVRDHLGKVKLLASKFSSLLSSKLAELFVFEWVFDLVQLFSSELLGLDV